MSEYIKHNRSTGLSDALASADLNTIFFTKDTQEIVMGHKLFGPKYMSPTSDLNITTSTEIGVLKNNIIAELNKLNFGVGANLTIPANLVWKWDLDDTTLINRSSVYSMIKIGGGYNGSDNGQYLLSSYGDFDIDYIGRSGGAWTPRRSLLSTKHLITTLYAENASEKRSQVAGRQYAVQKDLNGILSVNVPWTDTISTIDLSNCVKRTGDTMTGNLGFSGDAAINFFDGRVSILGCNLEGLLINTHDGASIILDYGYVKLEGSNAYFNNNELLHANNYNQYALPLTGGTLTGPLIIQEGLSCIDFGDGNTITSNGNIYFAKKVYFDNSVEASAFYETSDIRKKEIKLEVDLNRCYDLIDKCQTIIYQLKGLSTELIGLIAQEIEEFFPELVSTDAQGFKSLAYDRLVVICFKVLKDLIKRLNKLESNEL